MPTPIGTMVLAPAALMVMAAASLSGCAARGCPRPEDLCIRWNQEFLERQWSMHRSAVRPCSSRLDSDGHPDFDDPRSVLRFVLARAPERAVVYPTERYYYFEFPLRERLVAGNLRFVDAERGVLHLGYFDRHDQAEIRSMSLCEADGVAIRYNEDTHEVTVRYESIERVFELDTAALDQSGELVLLPGESFVTGVRDESGFAFSLLYHEAACAFYYVLNRALPLPDELAEIRTDRAHYMIGIRSRFVFYEDAPTGRLILVGVSEREIAENTYFDGPFDQVPPHLEIREKLEAAYPYVRLRGGIDEHGNFRALKDQRVAISPYQAYDTLRHLLTMLDGAVRPEEEGAARWLGLVFESKRDFHRRFVGPVDQVGEPVRTDGGVVHEVERSRVWPANHWVGPSLRWGADHDSRTSVSWPPNHAERSSREN